MLILSLSVACARTHARTHARTRTRVRMRTHPRLDPNLPDPVCQASILRSGTSLFFANPGQVNGRVNGALRRSDDAGASWQKVLTVAPGLPFAYSCLVNVGAGSLARSNQSVDARRKVPTGTPPASTIGLLWETSLPGGGCKSGSTSCHILYSILPTASQEQDQELPELFGTNPLRSQLPPPPPPPPPRSAPLYRPTPVIHFTPPCYYREGGWHDTAGALLHPVTHIWHIFVGSIWQHLSTPNLVDWTVVGAPRGMGGSGTLLYDHAENVTVAVTGTVEAFTSHSTSLAEFDSRGEIFKTHDPLDPTGKTGCWDPVMCKSAVVQRSGGGVVWRCC